MSTKTNIEYTGDKLEAPYVVKRGRENKVEIPVYLPDEDLVQAVNLAIYLRKPLLLMGEPGCGKTRLAEALAYELHGKNYKDNYFEWFVKSSTKAKDGIYAFDAIKRLRQTEINKESELNKENKLSGKDLEAYFIKKGYIRKGPLANSLDKSEKAKIPPILLIDEIDKAEIDFPNDLLLELDQSRYYISETDTFTQFDKGERPVIIITSNNEKELPAAFLRRCLFQFIKFPKRSQLEAILKGRFGEAEAELQKDTVAAFIKIRERMSRNLSEKRISTGELVDWFTAVRKGPDETLKESGVSIETSLQKIISNIDSGRVHIPYHQVLLKNWESVRSLLPQSH